MADFIPPESGFGSYLYDILPKDVAIAAGAFSTAMQQIRNVKYVSYEKLAQVVRHTETTKGLSKVGGDNAKPTNTKQIKDGQKNVALGSGPHGTYTVSDFFGAMSGLPYFYEDIYSLIRKLQTTKLCNIYHELYLAVTWTGAAVTVSTESQNFGTPEAPDIRYRVSSLSISNPGGGYGRGTAPPPTITTSNGGSASTTINTNVDNCDTGLFGQVISITNLNKGSWQTSPTITAEIQYPPTATLAVQSSGARSTSGSNTAFGTTGYASPMQAVVQAYVDQANTEIISIKNRNPVDVRKLNKVTDLSGYHLGQEQRSRFLGIPPVPIVDNQTLNNSGAKDERLNMYPDTLYQFADKVPIWAQNTLPHMYAQTFEVISDRSNICGESLIGMMREARNKERLTKLGIDQDNNIPESMLNPEVLQSAMTMPPRSLTAGSLSNIRPTTESTIIESPTSGSATGFNNASSGTTGGTTGGLAIGSTIIAPPLIEEYGSYSGTSTTPISMCDLGLKKIKTQTGLSYKPEQELKLTYDVDNYIEGNVVSYNSNTGDLVLNATSYTAATCPSILSPVTIGLSLPPALENISNIMEGTGHTLPPAVGYAPVGFVELENLTFRQTTGSKEKSPLDIPISGPYITTGPDDVPDVGQGVLGSLGGSPYKNIMEFNLNTNYTAPIIEGSSYDVNDAIDQVTLCNCDCWLGT